MPDLLSVADHEELLEATGGVEVAHGGETTRGHLEQLPERVLGTDGGEVLTERPSVVIPSGGLTGITREAGIGETLTTQALDSAGNTTGSATSWVVTGVEPADQDGGVIRVLLADG